MVACYSCQGHAAEEVSPLTRHTGSARKSNGLGATATAARLSRRAGRPKTRRAEDGVAILRALAEAVTVTGGSFASRNLKKNLVGPGARPRPQPALPRQGVGQWPGNCRLIAARGSLAGQSGLVFDIAPGPRRARSKVIIVLTPVSDIKGLPHLGALFLLPLDELLRLREPQKWILQPIWDLGGHA